MGPGVGLGVVLHGKRRDVQKRDALGRAVVEVHVRQLDAAEAFVLHHGGNAGAHPEAQVAFVALETAGQLRHQRAQAGEQQAEAVVLRRDLHAVA